MSKGPRVAHAQLQQLTWPSLELMRAHANCLSLTAIPSRAIAFSMAVSASVATWCPNPLLPAIVQQHC